MTAHMTAHLIHHLLTLYAHSRHGRHAWLAYFKREQPGMPRGYYGQLVTWLIRAWPGQMRAILAGLPSDL